MRISDWSSDVCSSDLLPKADCQAIQHNDAPGELRPFHEQDGGKGHKGETQGPQQQRWYFTQRQQIGRASWRERVCQNVWISVVAASLKKKKSNITNIQPRQMNNPKLNKDKKHK